MVRRVEIKSKCKRGISNLLALLIIVTIVIGVAIAVSGIGAKILMVMAPKGSDLVLSGFTWLYRPINNGLIVHVRGVVTNVGTDSMNITRAYLIVDNKEYPLEFRRIENLEPNDVSEFNGKTIIKEFPETNLLTIIVEYCTPRECTESITNARLDSMAFVINKNIFGATATVTVPQTVTTTVVQTVTQTETVTQPATTTTTTTQTTTATITMTTTATATVTTTTTATITKPAWPVEFESCYGVDDYVYVWGSLDKKVNKDAEYIPYVLRVYDCTVLGCNLVGTVPFEWGSPFNPSSSSSIQAKYGPIQVKPFHTIKVEVWSININTASLKDKIWEETVNTSVRCA